MTVRIDAMTPTMVLVLAALAVAPAAAARQAPAASAAADAQATQQPRSQVPTLGRPTKAEDPAPQLDFLAYFAGTWEFVWDYPDSALGPAGALEGKTSYRALDDQFFEATTTGTTAEGPVTIREVIGYRRDEQVLARTVTDSRGFTFTQIGTVGGDLGGQFTIRLESAPFVHKGETLRVRTIMRLLSPHNYRTQTMISVNGGPFTNYGNPWWRKEGKEGWD